MNASVEFHVLESAHDSVWLQYVCELTEALHHPAHRLVIHADEPALLTAVDEKLWTYKDDGFLAHERTTQPTSPAPNGVVMLSSTPIATDTLIHLGFDPLADLTTAKRIIDVIDADPKRREAGRNRFAHYRKLGISPQTIKNPTISAAAAGT
jgi:DNA polymerase III subunit chi